ncbi:hypothetical protein B0J18DRAFT_414691 [Chaetomium sp. MPI-SDFR-AT-0129]|nr:hypothetical protein B0J18DRAFT_414691 [Chaetomium sp. MPI-SDFR-AT-0129]
MAVLSSLRHVRVFVETAQRGPLPEFEHPDPKSELPQAESFHLSQGRVPTDPLPHVIKYIEARAAEDFVISIRTSSLPNPRTVGNIGCHLRIDGRLIAARLPVFQRCDQLGQPVWEYRFRHMITGNARDGYELHAFQFTPLDIVEDDNLSPEELAHQRDRAKTCGSVTLSLHLVSNPRVMGPHTMDAPRSDLSFAEKGLKGRATDSATTYISHALPRRIQPHSIGATYSDPQRRPFAVYEFRYRSRKGLVAEGIDITPRTITDRVNRARELLTIQAEAEARRHIARIPGAGEMQQPGRIVAADSSDAESPRGIKREREEDNDEEDAKARAEGKSVIRYKERRTEEGRVVIDLTED